MAVISNASLLWQADIRAQLLQADAVSLKVDAVEEIAWAQDQPPARPAQTGAVFYRESGISHAQFKGRLLTETMLVKDVNTSPEHVRACAKFIAGLKPEMAYLALPLRSRGGRLGGSARKAGNRAGTAGFRRAFQPQRPDDRPA